MKEKTVIKRCLALLLAFAMVISGLTIPEGKATVAEAAEETTSATNIEGANAENSVAKIGDAYFMTFDSALSAAQEGYTIELLADITISAQTTVAKNITIDGNDHTVSTTCANAIKVNENANVEFKNMKINHTASKAAFLFWNAGNVGLTNVTIDVKSVSNYESAPIQILGGTKKLKLTSVNATMDQVSTKDANAKHAIIGVGYQNTATNKVTDLDIEIKDCTLNAGTSANVYCVIILKLSTANVKIEDSTLISKDVYPIKDRQTDTLEKFETTNVKLATKDKVACIGTTLYDSFEAAYEVAEAGDTIELLADITISTQTTVAKDITIDGNNHTVSTTCTDAIKVNASANVEFKNMKVNHTVSKAAFFLWNAGKVGLTNVTIGATLESGYEDSLIQIRGSRVELTLKNVTATMNVGLADESDKHAIVTAGYWESTSGSKAATNVKINIEDCNLDASGTSGVRCVLIMNTSTAVVTIKDSTLTTKNMYPIKDRKTNTLANFTTTNVKLATTDYAAQVGTTLYTYENLSKAIAATKDKDSDVTLEILQDITIDTWDIYSANGNNVTIEGNNHTVTTAEKTASSNDNAFRIYGSAEGSGTYELKNLDIVHTKPGVAVQVTSKTAKTTNEETGEETTTVTHTTKNATVKLTDVTINTKKVNEDETVVYGGYMYGLITTLPVTEETEVGMTLELKNVVATMDVDDETLNSHSDSYKSIIRTGNPNDSKNINIKLDNCIFDTTNASGVNGIVVQKETAATLDIKDSTIKTKDTYAVKVNKEAGLIALTMDNSVLTSDAALYALNPIYNSDGHKAIKNLPFDNLAGYRTTKDTFYHALYELMGETVPHANDLYEAPAVLEGYIFGGLYANEDLTDSLTEEELSANVPENAYAKLVPEHVMSVKAQLSANLIDTDDTNNETGTIRFVTTTDSLRYQEMGFKYAIENINDPNGTSNIMEGITSSNTAYTEIYELAENGDVMKYQPSIFCSQSQYFKTLIIEDIPQGFYGADITVQPFWITLDGTIVWGEEVTKTINEGMEKTGWNNDNTTADTDEYNRVVLLSDLHYTAQDYDYNASVAQGTMLGYTQEEKIATAVADINNFAQKKKLTLFSC